MAKHRHKNKKGLRRSKQMTIVQRHWPHQSKPMLMVAPVVKVHRVDLFSTEICVGE